MATLLLPLLYLAVFLLSALILIFSHPFSRLRNKDGLPRNWPVLGMLPDILPNINNLLDYGARVTNKTGYTTYMINGPWFSNLRLLLTIDPANIQYTSSKRFSNFPRGPKSKERFDVFGNGIFNLDGNEWEVHRKMHRSFFSQRQFNKFIYGFVVEKVDKGIRVALDHVANGGELRGCEKGVVDLEDLFSRYTYDLTYRMAVGSDPTTLSLQWPEVPYTKAMWSAMQSVWMRHALPESIWKLQRKLGIGHEKALMKAKKTLDQLSTSIISSKHKEFNSQSTEISEDNNFKDMVAMYLMKDGRYRSGEGDDYLGWEVIFLLLAGKESTAATLTWFFWILSNHPSIEAKIREEITRVIGDEERVKPHTFDIEESSRLTYLHATLCETLRLYPPIPFQTRIALESDILPSGHEVNPNSTMVVIPLYFMARSEVIWGKDCAEFKPERWISEDGMLINVPSRKFFTFNSGFRICQGREVAMMEMKIAAATIIHNYNVHVLPEQKVAPVYSIILNTKRGLLARVSKRQI